MRQCYICIQPDKELSWKNTDILRRFMTQENKISSRRQTGCCAKHQRKVARAIRRARVAGLLPYVNMIGK